MECIRPAYNGLVIVLTLLIMLESNMCTSERQAVQGEGPRASSNIGALLQEHAPVEKSATRTPVAFTLTMEFGEHVPGGTNTTISLRQNFVRFVAEAFGIESSDVETKASLQYFRKVSQATNGAEELEGTYLRRAVVNTSAYFPTEAAANMAYLAMTSNQEAWVTKTFHREEFPTLEYAAAKNIVLGEQQEAPPIITLPSSWVERAPVLFSAIVHAEADDGRNAPLREQMLQDRFQDELRKAAGVPKSDVEILNLRSQDVRASPKVTDGITYAVMAAIVFDNRATASKWAGNLADMLKGNNQTSFPLLSVSSITQVTLLHQNLPERPVPPSAANVDLAPSQSALRFVMSAAFELSASNTIDASDVGRFVDEYLQQVADAVGVSRHQVIVGLKQINYANVTSIINSQLLFKEVVRSIATDIYLVFSDLSAAMLWLEEIPTLGQSFRPNANVAYTIAIYGQEVLYGNARGHADHESSDRASAHLPDDPLHVPSFTVSFPSRVAVRRRLIDAQECPAYCVMFTIVMDVEINSTAGVTSVEQESNTIVNSLPVETEAYVDSLSISDLQPYPGYSGDIVVTGFGEHMGVAGYPDDSLRLFAILTGLPPSSTGDVRVHEGYTCETSGPRFLSPTTGEDPWIHASYTSDEFGRAEVNVVGYNSSLVSVVGRAFVVYDPDGSRVSCGIISGESPGLPSHVNATELQKYPMYTGPWRPSGNLTITLANTSSVRVSSSNVAGLPFSSFGNIFLHEGHSCDDIGEQLPSPITRVNDWGAINNFYFVDDNGQADISLSVEGYPLSSIVNRTLVLQDEQADILSCATTFVDAKGTASPSNVHVIETVVTPRGAVSDSKVVFELAVTAQAILDSEEAQKSWAKALAEDDDRLQVFTSSRSNSPIISTVIEDVTVSANASLGVIPTPSATTPTPTPAATPAPTPIPTYPDATPSATPTATPTSTPTYTSNPNQTPGTRAPLTGTYTPTPSAQPAVTPSVPPPSTQTPISHPTPPPCECPLNFTAAFRFEAQTAHPDTIQAQISKALEAFINSLSKALAGNSTSYAVIQGVNVLTGVTEQSDGTTMVVLAGLEIVTTVLFTDCADATAWEDVLETNTFWPRETFSSVIPDIDTIQIKNVEALPINNATGTCAGPVTTIPTPTPTAYSPPNATHAPTPTTGDCGKYYVVEWLLKTITNPETASSEASSSADMAWPDELEHHWQIQTVPDLRRIISAEMGVPRDSWRIEYGDELHDKYRLEELHVSEWEECDSHGMKKVATVRTYFDTEKEAKDFKEWVSSRRGHNVVQPLLELDVMLCGASIKLPRQAINLEEYCHNDDEEKYYESHAANATTPAAQVDGKYNITGNQTTLSSVTRGGSAVAANTEAGEQAGTLLEQPLPIAAMTNQVYDSPAVQSGPALESSAAACECRLQLTSTFQFEPVITPDKDAQAQVEGALGIYIEALSAATAGLDASFASIDGVNVLRGETETSNGATAEVLAGLEVATTLIFPDCASASRSESILKGNISWAQEVFAPAFPDLVTAQVGNVNLVQISNATTGAECQGYSGPVLSYTPTPSHSGCMDYQGVEWYVKAIAHAQTASSDASSGADMTWPTELEQHWESRTVPELRRIVSEELGVSVDSWRIEYDPELDDHRMEPLHGSEWEECDDDGIKKVATFRTFFDTEDEARDFKYWISNEDGRNVVEKLLNSDGEFLCGAKIKIPRNAVNAERICHSQQNTSEHRGGNKTSYDSGTSAPWSEHNGTDADQLVEGQELSAEELFDLGISYRKGGDGVVPKATLNWSASEWWPSNGKVSTAAAKASLAFHGGRCADVFSVSLELVLLPGYLNDEMGIASSDNSGRAWSTLADEHFYLFTNVLVRHLASSHLGAEAGKQQIKLSSHVTHTRGRISSYPGCASGVRKHVQYDFTFETERDAAVFRDWLKPDESKQLVEPLTRMDPAGVCGGKGDTGPVVNTRHCSTAVVGQPVKVPNSKFP